MEDGDLLKRIERHPRVMSGKAVIRGTRLTGEHILKLLPHGETVERIPAEDGGNLPGSCAGPASCSQPKP